MAKRKTKIVAALNSLSKTDIYSLLLFTLYKMEDDPKYSTLSELCYILEGKSLSKFLQYYGGMTIKIPTLKDMRRLTQTLLLYQYVNIEKNDFGSALKIVCGNEFTQSEIKETYKKLSDVIANYDFSRN